MSRERSHNLKAWVVCSSAALFFFFEFIQTNMFNAVNPGLMASFHVTGAKLGQLSAYYFYGIVIFLFSAGMILDRFSTRKVILTAMASCVLFTFLFSIATAVWQAEFCRFMTGIGGSFCFLSSVRLASRWFQPKRMALVVGSVVTFAMVGGMVAQTPFTLLTDCIGWRKALMLDAAMGVLILIVIALFVQDYPDGQKASPPSHNGIKLSESIWLSVKNLQNWVGGFYTSLMNLPIFILGAMWGSLYLVQIHHLSRSSASVVVSMIFVGTIIGSPFMGWLSDRLERRKAPMLVSALISLAVILVIMYAPELSLWELMFLFFVLGFITSAQIISYPLIAESNSLVLTGSAEGLASTLIMAGGFMQPVFGYFIELHWDHKLVDGLPVYSWGDYHTALLIMPIAFVLSFVISLCVKETYCRMQVN